jgi:TrmH family RNA methyltransferase
MEPRLTAKTVTSLTNPTVKAVRGLHLRRAREESGLFLVEGLRSVSEGVAQGRRPRILLHGPQAGAHPRLREAAAVADETLEVSEAILAKISRRDNPQMVLGVFDQRLTALDDLETSASACWVALEAVRDPGNLGTVVRTADAAGCGAVILVGDCCDPFSVEAVRATMGSIFATPIVTASRQAFLAWRGRWQGAVVGAHLAAEHDFRAAPYRAPNLILMGNEQAGLTPELVQACDVTVKIPMRGRADSLNLAVAAGIMIYAVTAP